MFPRPLSVYLIKKNGGAPDPNMHLNVTARGETNLRICFLSNPRILDISTRYKFFSLLESGYKLLIYPFLEFGNTNVHKWVAYDRPGERGPE